MAYQYHHLTSSSSPYQNPQDPIQLPYDHEIAILFRQLQANSQIKRLEVLKSLRKKVKRSSGCPLPVIKHTRTGYFEVFYLLLSQDNKVSVINECLMLIVELIPTIDGHDLDSCMSIILPRIIPLLGHEDAEVKRATIKVLHVYMRYTNNLQRVLSFYVQFGIENNQLKAKKGAIISLPLLFTEEFGNENLFILVESLSKFLLNADTSLFYPVFLAMQRLHSISGNELFKLYLKRIDQEAASLYRNVLSRNSTANSASPNGKVEANLLLPSKSPMHKPSVTPKHDKSKKATSYRNDNAIEIEKIITGGDSNAISAALKEFHEKDSFQVNNSDNVSEEITYIPPLTDHLQYTTFHPLEYGIFPHTLISRANSSKLNERLDAIDEINAIIREAPMSHVSQLVPHLMEFLSDFVGIQLDNANFKVNLSTLETIESLVERLKVSIMTNANQVVHLLYKRLGDSRTIVRDNVVRVFHQMMYTLPPQQILDILFEQKHSKNPKVREEVINRVTAAVSTFPRGEFNLPKLCFNLAPLLTDNRRSVRLATLECLAVLAQALGPHKLGPLMSAVDAVETACGCDGLVNALHARIARRALPRCNSDGSVRYVLNPSQLSNWYNAQGEADADIEWIMMASASISSSETPPKYPSLKIHQTKSNYNLSNVGSIGPSGIPKSNFDRRKSSSIAYIPPSVQVEDEDPDEIAQEEKIKKQEAREAFDMMVSGGFGGGILKTLEGKESRNDKVRSSPPPERQSYLDHFVGESIGSDENGINDDIKDNENSGEAWHEYFSQFRKQLAQTIGMESNNEFGSVLPDKIKIENSYNINQIHVDQKEKKLNGRFYSNSNPNLDRDYQESQVSSRASTASDETTAYIPPPPTKQLIGSYHDEPLQSTQFEEQTRHERSLSMPSITDISRPNSGDEKGIWHKNEPPPPTQEVTPSRNSVTFMTQLDEQERAHSEQQIHHQHLNEENQRTDETRLTPSKYYEQSFDDKSEHQPNNEETASQIEGNEITDQQIGTNIGNKRDSADSTLNLDQIDESTNATNVHHAQPPSLQVTFQQTPTPRNRLKSINEDVRIDVSTQKDETLSSETSSEIGVPEPRDIKQNQARRAAIKTKQQQPTVKGVQTPIVRRRAQPIVKRRTSRSISPQPARRLSRPPQQLYIKTTPAIPANANIRNILSNVAKTEGPFTNPSESVKAALLALQDDAWTTKVEGMVAVERLATFHPSALLKDQHAIARALVHEVKNLRSTVARSAIFTIGELFAKLKYQIEPEMDKMVQALLHKSGENVVFIREDIERALLNMIDYMPQTRAAISLIINGSNHRNSYVRKTTAQFLTILVEKMGPTKCMLGPRDIGEHLLPAAARFVQDGSPHTRYFGRKMLYVLQQHPAFEKLLRKHVSPGTYRNICGILESIKRRGPGDRPNDLMSPCKSNPQNESITP